MTHIQTERPQQKTTSPIYPQPISVSGLIGPSRRILGFGGAGVLFYATSARTQHHCPSPTVQLHPSSPQRSQSSVMPLDGASNISPESTCPFMSLAVFTNSQSSLTLLNSASYLLAPNVVWTIWSSIATYLIKSNCSSIGSLVTAIYVPMRLRTC